jgi:2-hydroxychromene-2-carboxylate isomerase
VEPIDVQLFFNFRSPYCYLASKSLFSIFEDFHARLVWRPLGGWDGRSAPDRAKVKVPLTRQDIARWARKMGIPCIPPPISTEPTRAGAGSLLAEERGLLRPYLVEMMRREWAEGKDIGDPAEILDVGVRVGLNRDELTAAIDAPERHAQLKANWAQAQELGVIGVPTFVIDDQIFWGNDRIEFVRDYLGEKRLRRI